jgi:F0F1-type ATP synthase membrane subunit b/b'
MEEIARSLGQLLWQAVPTSLLVILFVLLMRPLFFKPFARVMEEREAAISGARRKAEENSALVEEKTRRYEDAMHMARADIYRQQEEIRREALEERVALLKEARGQANGEIQQRKAQIATELADARRQVEAETLLLADEIVRAILAPNGRTLGRRPTA